MVLAPRPGTITMRNALHYTLSHPVSTVSYCRLRFSRIAGREHRFSAILPPISNSQMAVLEVKTEPVANQALFFCHMDGA